MIDRRAPQACPAWHEITPSSLRIRCDEAIARSRAVQDRVAALSHEAATFESVVDPLARQEGDFDAATSLLTFLQHVSPDDALRNEAAAADKRIQDFQIEASLRVDVYDSVQRAAKNTPRQSLSAESQRLLDHMLRDGRRAGLSLPPKERERVSQLKKKLAGCQTDWQKLYTEENGGETFSRSELQGVPESILDGLATSEVNGETRYRVTHKPTDHMPVMDHARLVSSRKRLWLSYEDRLANATSLFREIIRLRQQLKSALKATTWADHVLEVRMAKNAKTAIAFVDDLIRKLTPIGIAERSRLLNLQNQMDAEDGIEHDPRYLAWSSRFLDAEYKRRTFSMDDEFIKAHFPVDVVVPRIFDIYKRLLGVQFRELPHASSWHPDVKAYEVWDAADRKEDAFMGYLYLDLYPRQAKYSHAAVWGLVMGCEQVDGARRYPVCAMVANLAKPTPNAPALMDHRQVVTLMHEMGHAFHQLCSRTRYARFHGTRVARDFVEAPSQMLENWTYTRDQLRYISSHHETGKPLPDNVIESIVQAELVNGGLFNLRQLFFAKFDLLIHTTDDELDLLKLWCELREEVSLVGFDGEYRPGYSSFGHLVRGYDSAYYGYLYSQAFSVDMWTRFESDPMSETTGKRYRECILSPGGSRDEMESLTEFLGRAPSNEAFMKKLLSSMPQSMSHERTTETPGTAVHL